MPAADKVIVTNVSALKLKYADNTRLYRAR